MLWCRCVLSFKMGGRCVLSFKMGFRVCGSRGVRDVHVISCTRVVQCFSTFYKIGVAVSNPVRTKAVYGKCKIPKKRVPIVYTSTW